MFIWFFWIQFSFYLWDINNLKRKKEKNEKEIQEKTWAIINEKKVLKLKKASFSLKYTINVNDKDLWLNNFYKNANFLKNEIISKIKKDTFLKEITNYNNYVLKIVFDWKINWYHTSEILLLFNLKETKSLLLYVTEILKIKKIDTWEITENYNELIRNNELFFLSLKKALEKNYNLKLKNDKKEFNDNYF